MRAVLGVISLLIALALVGVLAKKQLRAFSKAPGSPHSPAVDPAAAAPATLPGASPQAQSQQLQQQIQKTLENTLQQARPMPDN